MRIHLTSPGPRHSLKGAVDDVRWVDLQLLKQRVDEDEQHQVCEDLQLPTPDIHLWWKWGKLNETKRCTFHGFTFFFSLGTISPCEPEAKESRWFFCQDNVPATRFTELFLCYCWNCRPKRAKGRKKMNSEIHLKWGHTKHNESCLAPCLIFLLLVSFGTCLEKEKKKMELILFKYVSSSWKWVNVPSNCSYWGGPNQAASGSNYSIAVSDTVWLAGSWKVGGSSSPARISSSIDDKRSSNVSKKCWKAFRNDSHRLYMGPLDNTVWTTASTLGFISICCSFSAVFSSSTMSPPRSDMRHI